MGESVADIPNDAAVVSGLFREGAEENERHVRLCTVVVHTLAIDGYGTWTMQACYVCVLGKSEYEDGEFVDAGSFCRVGSK